MLTVIVAFLLSALGGIMVAKKDIRGFYVWLVSNPLWVYISGLSWAGAMFAFYTFLTVYSIYEWR